METLKFNSFHYFWGHFWVFWVNQKGQKNSTNTYRMILILRQLNSMGELL